MQRFLVRLIINAVALWLTTLIVSGISVDAFPPAETLETVLTYLIVALVFGVVNAVIGNTIRIVAFPLYVLTLGLLALVVNALLLLIVQWISTLLGVGLVVESFWWGVLGALVLGFIGWVLGLVFRPLMGSDRGRGRGRS
jgi:putative membrane protein